MLLSLFVYILISFKNFKVVSPAKFVNKSYKLLTLWNICRTSGQLKGRTGYILVEVLFNTSPSVITTGDCQIIIKKVCSWIIVGNVFVDFTKEYMYFSHYTIDGERGGGGVSSRWGIVILSYYNTGSLFVEHSR